MWGGGLLSKAGRDTQETKRVEQGKGNAESRNSKGRGFKERGTRAVAGDQMREISDVPFRKRKKERKVVKKSGCRKNAISERGCRRRSGKRIVGSYSWFKMCGGKIGSKKRAPTEGN